MELKHQVKALKEAGLNLLIVPYGIETRKPPGGLPYYASFNRTLWN